MPCAPVIRHGLSAFSRIRRNTLRYCALRLLFAFFDLKQYLESLLKRRVDLTTPEALKPQLRDRILSEAVRAA
jgi:hypothetical protein